MNIYNIKNEFSFSKFKYILEIHSHTLFTHYWDIELLNEYNAAVSINNNNTNIIITSNPSNSKDIAKREFTHNKGQTMNIMCGTMYDTKQNIIRYSASWEIKPVTCHIPPVSIMEPDNSNVNSYKNDKYNSVHVKSDHSDNLDSNTLASAPPPPPPPVPLHVQSRYMEHYLRLHPFEQICDPLEVPFITFLFNFGPISRLKNIPYDPYLKYINEQNGIEFYMSVRLRTNGYKMYAPAQDIVFHSYTMDRNINKNRYDNVIHTPKYQQRHGHITHETTIDAVTATKVKKNKNNDNGNNFNTKHTHNGDNASETDKQFDIFIEQGINNDINRIQYVLQMKQNMSNDAYEINNNADYLQDIDKYGLGNNITLDRYLQLVKVNLTEKKAGNDHLCHRIRYGLWKS